MNTKRTHSSLHNSPFRRALLVAVIYAVFAEIWIVASDWLLSSLVHEWSRLLQAQTVKGGLFVLVTASLLFVLLYRLLRSDAQFMQQLDAQRAAINELNQFRESVIDNASIWIHVVDPDARVSVWNKAAEQISGYPRDEVLGCDDMFERLYPDPDYRRGVMMKFRQIREQGEEVVGYETRILCRSGDQKTIAWNSRRFFFADGRTGSIAIGQDVTERNRVQQELEQHAQEDPLTGLYNRRRLESMARSALHDAHARNHSLALLWIDVDHYKQVNDRYGHQAGDAVLRELARLLRRELRPGDHAARFGGDELVVALPDMDGERAAALAERLREQMHAADLLAPYDAGAALTVSIGVAAFPDDGLNIEQLTEAADHAMYAAKRGGRNRVCLANGRATAAGRPQPG